MFGMFVGGRRGGFGEGVGAYRAEVCTSARRNIWRVIVDLVFFIATPLLCGG